MHPFGCGYFAMGTLSRPPIRYRVWSHRLSSGRG